MTYGFRISGKEYGSQWHLYACPVLCMVCVCVCVCVCVHVEAHYSVCHYSVCHSIQCPGSARDSNTPLCGWTHCWCWSTKGRDTSCGLGGSDGYLGLRQFLLMGTDMDNLQILWRMMATLLHPSTSFHKLHGTCGLCSTTVYTSCLSLPVS